MSPRQRRADAIRAAIAGTPTKLPGEPHRLAAWLRTRGMSSLDLAEKCGVSRSLAHKWVQGLRRPSWEACETIGLLIGRTTRYVGREIRGKTIAPSQSSR